MRIFSLIIFLPLLLLAASCSGIKKSETRLYTFSRAYEKGSDLSPRGGTTTGPEVKLSEEPSPEWVSLREEGISPQERDRRAILAMAGDYRATFEFIETVPFLSSYEMDRPYRSWATERIYVIEDSGDFISLQHILVMFFAEDDEITGPVVVKHWRQDWTFEPENYHEYSGNNRWDLVELSRKKSRGKWLQEVFHVDDSPRYASLGKWEHTDNYSEWRGNRTYRPLPRREFSVRSDYNALDGENRHVILPTGWVHEQENLKLVLSKNGEKDYLAKEIGLNSYDRIVDFDFSSGDEYWQRTGDYWKAVREVWSRIYEENPAFTLNPDLYGTSLIGEQFYFADNYEGNLTQEELSEQAGKIIIPHIVLDKNK